MTTASVDPEHGLLDGLARGDSAALETVIERHAARLYRLAHGITRSAADAEAVVQEVFASLAEPHVHSGRAVPLRTWLDGATTRAALARAAAHASPAWAAALDRWLPAFLADGHREGERAFVTADWSTQPDARLVADGALDIVHDLLDSVTGVDRAILLLTDLEGRGAGEVGAMVGIHPEAVRARVHHLRMALREHVTRMLLPPTPLR